VDSRSKIQAVDEVRGGARIVVVGYFDPLSAAHVRRLNGLRENGQRLTVVVADPPAPLLPLRARAELVAGLACVDLVIQAPTNVEGVLTQLQAETVIDERGADGIRAEQLARQVVARCHLR
jgi:hypothetical protein